jgi:uncharacterized OB-fold protein
MSLHQGISSKPRPRVSPDNKPFWDGCKQHRLLLPFCEDCGKPHLPPGPVCPHCFSDRLAWREARGRGKVSTWVVVHKAWFPAFAEDVPYNVVQVELAEGPRLTAKMVGLRDRKIEVGQEVIVGFEDVDDELTMPCFRLA